MEPRSSTGSHAERYWKEGAHEALKGSLEAGWGGITPQHQGSQTTSIRITWEASSSKIPSSWWDFWSSGFEEGAGHKCIFPINSPESSEARHL